MIIAKVINAKYSIDDQIAIIRQKETKPEEYEALQVKADVKAEYVAFEAETDSE